MNRKYQRFWREALKLLLNKAKAPQVCDATMFNAYSNAWNINKSYAFSASGNETKNVVPWFSFVSNQI
jgi:hypothetical protein